MLSVQRSIPSVRLPGLWLAPLLALFWVLPAASQDEPALEHTHAPLLWRIGSAQPSYLFGTIHIADERVLALHPIVDEALENSDALYTELPMDPKTMLASMQHMMLPGDTTLVDLLPPELYGRTERFVASKGFSIQMFSKFKLWALSASLTFLEAMQNMTANEPLDLYLYTRASNAGKEVGGIETVSEQIAILGSLSREEEVDFLLKTLETLEQAEADGTNYLEQLIDAYLQGDEDALLEFLFEFGDANDPLVGKYLDRLLGDRNRLMAQRITQKLQERPETAFFFALGAGHLGGEEGLVALLRAQGLQVERLVPAATATTATR